MLEGIKNLLRPEKEEPAGFRMHLVLSEPYGKQPEAIQSPCCGPQGCTPVADPCCGAGCDSNCPCR